MRKASSLLLVGVLLLVASTYVYGSESTAEKTLGIAVEVPPYAEFEILSGGETFQLAFEKGATQSNSHSIEFLTKRNAHFYWTIDAEPLGVENLNVKLLLDLWVSSGYRPYSPSSGSDEKLVGEGVEWSFNNVQQGTNRWRLTALAWIEEGKDWPDVHAGSYSKNIYMTIFPPN
jgi:hypothetical protein